MTLASMVPIVLLLLMGKRQGAPPPWPGQRPPAPRGRTIPQRPAPRPRPAPRNTGTLPGFIPPDHPILTAMPVGPGVPIRSRPTTPTRPIDHLPIRSPGWPTAPISTRPRPARPPTGGPPPELHVPDDVLHPPPPHFDIPEIPPDIEMPPEVVISPIEHEEGPAVEPPPDDDEAEKIVVVRKGEGLSQVAQRLGQPGGLASVRELRAANIPHGPHNDWETTKTGNLTIPGQPNRGLQPGDTLFVPAAWL